MYKILKINSVLEDKPFKFKDGKDGVIYSWFCDISDGQKTIEKAKIVTFSKDVKSSFSAGKDYDLEYSEKNGFTQWNIKNPEKKQFQQFQKKKYSYEEYDRFIANCFKTINKIPGLDNKDKVEVFKALISNAELVDMSK